MIDLHTHTLLSDGLLCPAEMVQRAKETGYRVLGITDHVDSTKLDWVIPTLVRFCEEINRVENSIKVIPGVELTHLPPSLIKSYASKARQKGAKIVIVHGETIIEPVPPGTNLAALKADVDILAHPGLIKDEEVKLAAEKGIYLEISARKGHCLTNGRIVSLAKKYGARLIINTDAHSPEDLIPLSRAEKILLGAGLEPEEVKRVLENSEKFVGNLSL
ncbi:PHP domain-containing protein [Candidatus Aerophobetes bacterium]|uniref:PHP domain-containing protein n=1 Tax=Aerophobetes bacterium TaxID=2030807 RepID=A0A662DIH2_UNCAE|nr:MAG: PHP domain-containing protein [Candidatus Aerophobetes bacterium]